MAPYPRLKEVIETAMRAAGMGHHVIVMDHNPSDTEVHNITASLGSTVVVVDNSTYTNTSTACDSTFFEMSNFPTPKIEYTADCGFPYKWKGFAYPVRHKTPHKASCARIRPIRCLLPRHIWSGQRHSPRWGQERWKAKT